MATLRHRTALIATPRWRSLRGIPAPPFAVAIWVIAACCGTSIGAEVSVGIQGHYRVGHWTAVRVTDGEFDLIETRDGDGVEVRFEHTDPESPWGYAIAGSEAAPLILRRDEDAVLSTRFPTAGSPSRGPAMIPLKTPWIVVIGDPLGIDRIGYNEILGRDAVFAVSKPSLSNALPDSVLGFDGVDMMLIGSSGIDLLQGLKPNQQQAIADWITEGGRLFLTLGESGPQLLQAAPWLETLLPLQQPTTVTMDPSAVETFTSSQTPLGTFDGVRLPQGRGRTLLLGRTTRRVSVPLAVEYNVGFGRITVVAANLEDEMFAQWPNRLELITRLTGDILIPQQDRGSRQSRATAFDDLAGQLRLTLDQFSIRRTFGFSIVSLILMALIAAIGPLDYLVINRVFGRPLLGWLSFPLITIGLSVILVTQARPSDSATAGSASTAIDELIRCNRIEVFDIDTTEGIGRGFAASYLYSHEAARFDVDVDPTSSLDLISQSAPEILSAPFGYPGESFGGIQIAIEDSRLPVYSISSDAESSTDRGTVLRGLPLASRSSKGLSSVCRFEPKVTSVSLEHRPGSELLQGELVNPLPIDVLDGMLIFRNWAYLLPTRFPAGGRIAVIDSLRQKNFRWQLSRQRALESASESEAWDPTDTQSLRRVAEMLMFHEAVGGARYTSLEHAALPFLDLTHVLSEDRCILVGRVADPMTELKVHDGNDQSSHSPLGERLTMVRIVIPVVESNPDQ